MAPTDAALVFWLPIGVDGLGSSDMDFLFFTDLGRGVVAGGTVAVKAAATEAALPADDEVAAPAPNEPASPVKTAAF